MWGVKSKFQKFSRSFQEVFKVFQKFSKFSEVFKVDQKYINGGARKRKKGLH